jgi:predicted nucleotidyltransferase
MTGYLYGKQDGWGPDSPHCLTALQEVRLFLDPYRRSIHSLVLFGSFAQGRAGKGSDVDLLVAFKKGRRARKVSFRAFHFQLEMEGRRDEPDEAHIQLVDFDEDQLEETFRLSTPLAHAFRHGVIVWDDGYFHSLLLRSFPRWPTREAAVQAFTRWIVFQYFHSTIDLKREIRRDHLPEGVCSGEEGCFGHFSGDILARVISRMLYVTLPERGMLPLGKTDLPAMTRQAYGNIDEEVTNLALEVLRKDRAITADEFRQMLPFARRLFKECIHICGHNNPAVTKSLKAHATLYTHPAHRPSTAPPSSGL